MDFPELERGSMDCIAVPQDRKMWRALVKAAINHRISIKCGEFLQ